MSNNNLENQENQITFNNSNIVLREEIEKYLFYYKWFVLGVVLALVVAFFYLRYTPKQYEVTAAILIEDKDNGGLSDELSAFKDLGFDTGAKRSIFNEIEIFKSRSLMEHVLKKMDANVTYFTNGRVIQSEMFKTQSPIKINFFDRDSTFYKKDTTFTVAVTSGTNFKLLDATENVVGNYVFGENCKTKFGDFTITPRNDKLKKGDNIIIHLQPLEGVVGRYRNAVKIIGLKKTSVIKLTLRDKVKVKAQAILNNLMKQYAQDAIKDQGLVARNTNIFIQGRLTIIAKDLLGLDNKVKEFKTVNNLIDIPSETAITLQSNTDLEKRIFDISTQLKLTEYVTQYINNNKQELIPSNLGFDDVSIESSTSAYNQLVLERNRMLQSSSKLNPIVNNLNNQIGQLKQSIAQSLINLKSSLTISIDNLKKREAIFNSKISRVPKQEMKFRDIKRRQQIIETLYLYLLKKREENSITLAVTTSNSKIIDKAYGSNAPVAPKKNIIYLAALLIGLLVPFSILYVKFLLDNKVHSRKDITEKVKAPMLAEIPNSKSENKIVINESVKNSIAESFRMLRTNINFMMGGVTTSENKKVIFVTSTLAGEGKTFIALNLATVLSLSDKKVLLIGADIRKPKIHEYLNLKFNKGLTQFLVDKTININGIINHFPNSNFDILSSGIVPPNPSELLMNGRFKEVLKYAKENYDYVIVDTAPVQVVTDTLLISSMADLCLYVIRSNFLDKRMLDLPKELFEEKRLPNMAIILNDVESKGGFGYGYGYGYGYGNEETKKPWWKKFLFLS